MGVPPSPTTATGCRGFYGIASPPASFRNDAADWTGTWLVDGAGHWVQQGATPALFLLSNEAPELARIRGIPHGIDLRSPSRHPDILGGDDLLIKVEEMREATGYRLPVSVKLGAGRVSDDVKIAVKDGFDFIELDGMQGSTGAGSAEVIDYVGVPTLPAIIEAIDALEEIGRRRPVAIDGSEHEILCGSVIVAVGQRSICEELHRADMMAPDRVCTEWDSMRTSDPMVFAAGDGAFGGSTIVMAMQHGQRAAYYLRHFLEGGGEITQTGVRFAPDRNEEERTSAVVNILEANAGEASMMARCAGKTRLHNIEPEDLRSVTRATAAVTGIPLTGTRAA